MADMRFCSGDAIVQHGATMTDFEIALSSWYLRLPT